ncbi:ABC transporter permease [Acidobacteria bacterium AB60]|nr:ABC transporter permease [Acidobacteria bacterium AB60]
MAGLLQDARFALRQLRKNPGFAVTATAMLAIAICANGTVLSWISGTMLHPIPGARQVGELVTLQRGERNVSPVPPLSYPDYRDLRDQNRSFSGILAYNHDWITITRPGATPERVYIANVTSNYFDVLGVRPFLGRFFLPQEETRPDAVPYIILSYSVWKTRYAGDASVVGKTIEVARHPVTIIGIAPEGFMGAMPGIRQDAWLSLNPIGSNNWRLTHRSAAFLNVVGRLRPGVDRLQAEEELDRLMRHLVAAYPNDHMGANTITLDPMWRSPFGANGYMASTLPILLAIAGVVLLLTCANVATLALVRLVSRRRELGIRQSLGANRIQLMRQIVFEGLIIALAGSALALLVTTWTAKTFAWFIPPNANPIVLNGTVDRDVVLGMFLLAVFATAICGALPAWRSSRIPPVEVLKDEAASISGGSSNRRLLSGLVVVQIAMSLALLVSSALFLQTLRNIAGADPGFSRDNILVASIGLNIAGYSNEDVRIIRHKILERVSALPGVKVASLTDWLPMSFMRKTADAYPEGYAPRLHESLEVRRADVTARYFQTLGIPIIEGRDFSPNDNDKNPAVLIVDEVAAHRFWPEKDPVGQKLMVWGRPKTVIGVVKHTTHQFMNERPEPMLYLSYFQQSDNETNLQVATQGDPDDYAPAIENAIHEISRQIPVYDVRSMRESTQVASIFAVMQSTFAAIFAVIALILAATGIYGVVAYRTQLRTHEIGVRVALGASRTDVLRLVLRQGMSLAGIGLALGLLLAFGLTRLIARLLYGVSPSDPATMIGVLLLLGAIALLASYLPAYRAMRLDPVAAIREQ